MNWYTPLHHFRKRQDWLDNNCEDIQALLDKTRRYSNNTKSAAKKDARNKIRRTV